MVKKVSEIKTNPKPMFYAVALEALRKRAFECGYALAIHGTCASDMDLIAVRWAENYETPEYLVEQFIAELSHYCFGDIDIDYFTNKEHRYKNQIHCSIPICGNWYVDLTIIEDK